MKKALSIGLILSILLLLFTSCSDPAPEKITPQSVTWYEYFGTVSVVQSFAGDDRSSFTATTDRVRELLKEYNELYDIYHEYSGVNNIRTINKNAGVRPVTVDQRIIDLLKYGIEVYELTSGEVNIMMGATLRLWHDAREGEDDGSHVLPSDGELLISAAHTDISSLVINEEESTVYISDPEASLDVGAIAKGFATDRIAEAIVADKELTSDGYVLNIGGNIKLIGTKQGNSWNVGITNPDKTSEEKYATMIEAANTSIVTSGDYERYFTVDGKNYHHIIDKDTLYPASLYHSITVVCESSALADALSTALFCMEKNAGYDFVNNLDGVEAYWISTNGNPVASPGFPLASEK